MSQTTGEGMPSAHAELRSAGAGAGPATAPAAARRWEPLRAPAREEFSPARRYRIREQGGGRVLVCAEAPTVTVRLERGRTVSEAAARRAEPGTVFLDGAAQGPPFLDPARSVYNLDHHEGCVRPFTLATCEQAMVLVRRIADLRRRDWTVWANEPDLDTVLAIWVLLNHHHLNGDDRRVRETVMPLLRVESVVDVHGLAHLELAGLPPDALAAAQGWMSALHERERALRSGGRWETMDGLTYLVDRLHAIDARVYPAGTFDDLKEIEELARVEIGGRSVAVACRSRMGIYETEAELRRLYGDRLGLVILERGPGSYSLRQVDPELPASLESLYGRLNLLDPAAGGARSENRWGGSSDIGGSPRRTGTRLRAPQIAEACRDAYRRSSPRERLTALLRAALGSAALLGAAALAAVLASAWDPSLPGGAAAAFSAALGLAAAGVLIRARHAPGLYGLRSAGDRAAWALAPLALFGAALGGVWTPEISAAGLPPALAPGLGPACALLLAAGSELVFRGWVQGRMAWALLRTREGVTRGGSAAGLLSGLLSAPWIALPWLVARPASAALAGPLDAWAPAAGALLFGCSAGLIRARTDSVLLPMLLHALGALSLGALLLWL